MKFSDAKDVIIVGALIGVVYFIYKNRDKFDPTSDKNFAYQAANAAAQWLSGDTNQTFGGLIFDFFNPDASGESVYYTVTFPDGARHAIASSSVNYIGTFSFDGSVYRIVDDQNHAHYAVPIG